MKKKLMAIAVAGALGVPGVALAQASTVQIYGTLILNYNYLDSGAGKPNVDMFNAHDANIGFKGEEALGGGTSAWFQCESTMDVSGQSVQHTAAQLCGRNSAFGMKGGFGNVYAGIWDTPMKQTMGNFRPFSTSGAPPHAGGTARRAMRRGRAFFSPRRFQTNRQLREPGWAFRVRCWEQQTRRATSKRWGQLHRRQTNLITHATPTMGQGRQVRVPLTGIHRGSARAPLSRQPSHACGALPARRPMVH